MDLNSFSKRINVIADGVERNTNTTVRKAALAIDQTVVLATPVDTGRARSNWQVSLGGPPTDVVAPYSPGDKLGIGEQANAAAAISQAAGQIANRKPGQSIWISNGLDYIQKLNDGSSRQAPANFVEQAVRAGLSVVHDARVVP